MELAGAMTHMVDTIATGLVIGIAALIVVAMAMWCMRAR